jgi:hypothetical protein
MGVATTNEQPAQVMQGIAVPATSVNAQAFYAHTRRQTLPFATNRTFVGLGSTEIVTALQTGIISGLTIRVFGTVTTVKGTGTVATTAAWPLGLLKNVRFTANGQSNLINVSGPWLAAREMVINDGFTDRGVRKQFGIAQPAASTVGNVVQGTMSKSNDIWGTTSGGLELGSQVTAVADGTYAYDFELYVPICMDEDTLVGAIFAQTQATELALNVDWANQPINVQGGSGDLFALTGQGNVTAFTCSYTVEGIVYDIPQVGGQIIVPNLSLFHSYIMTRNTSVSQGDNEYTLPGQGVGKQLMRIGFRTMNPQTFATIANVPLPLPLWGPTGALPYTAVAANYGQIGWRYGGNQTPDLFTDGRHLAQWNERNFGTDFSSVYGIGWLDYSARNALRDSVDEGTATQLRLLYNIGSGVTLGTGVATEVVQETLFGAAAGA